MTSPCICVRPDGRYQCKNTGILFSPAAKPPIHCICDPATKPVVIDIETAEEFDADMHELGVAVEGDEHRNSLWMQWRTAVARWKKAGKPVRSEKEIAFCLSVCENCKHLGSRLGLPYCKVCKCNLKTPGIGSLSKIRMATEQCPKNKWRLYAKQTNRARPPKGKRKTAVNAKEYFPEGRNWKSSFRNPTTGLPDYITTDRLMQDTLSLIRKLPPDITMIAGGARSGLCPATLAAMMLHLPLVVIRNRQGDWVPGGHGWRLNEGKPKQDGKVLVLDDTTMTGNSLLRTKHVIQDLPGEKIFASVYVNPQAVNKPDIWEVDLPWPHLLEWNLFNSVLLDSFALDFDGILCHDCPVADDDDGERYLDFLANVRPLHVVRKKPIQLIVTARLERYRPQTLAWMDKWGVRAKRLVMGPWKTKRERSRASIAEFKAREIKSFLQGRRGIKPKMFIESDPRQAERIAQLTKSLVVCPPARRCFR